MTRPTAQGVWVDEFAYFVGSYWWSRRNGKLTTEREVFDRLAAAGVHVHHLTPLLSPSAGCANGDDVCPVWRAQQ